MSITGALGNAASGLAAWTLVQAPAQAQGETPDALVMRVSTEVIDAARDCAGILLQYAPITAAVVAALPRLGIVSRIGAGFDTVDIDDLFGERFHGRGPSPRTRTDLRVLPSHKPPLRLTAEVVPLTWCLPGSLIIGSFVHGTEGL